MKPNFFKSLNDFTMTKNQKLLGEGAFSKVHRVKCKIDNEQYALKVIDLSKLSRADTLHLK